MTDISISLIGSDGRIAVAAANRAVALLAQVIAAQSDVAAKAQNTVVAAGTVAQDLATIQGYLQTINQALQTINTDTAQVAANAAAVQSDRKEADAAAVQATGAAEAVAEGKFFPSYAAANAAVGTLANGSTVQVAPDETRNGHRTFYVVTNGALVFAFDASPAAMTKQERADLFALFASDGLFAALQGV